MFHPSSCPITSVYTPCIQVKEKQATTFFILLIVFEELYTRKKIFSENISLLVWALYFCIHIIVHMSNKANESSETNNVF